MKLYTKFLKSELSAINKISDICPYDKSRIFVDNMGRALAFRHKSCVTFKDISSDEVCAKYIIPRKIKFDGIILYIHGGGYVLGGMDYARGFAALIAAETGARVCCLAYRLAPENKFPAAVTDAYNAYNFLLREGYPPDKIILCGESAGGGLIYALALKLKSEDCPMPRGLIAMSPWSDLTLSGESYVFNRENDPSMTKKRVQFYAESYTDDVTDPLASPLFGDLTGLPPSLILAGGFEILLSDSIALHNKLILCGCKSELDIAPEMWHVYLMYNTAESKDGFNKINDFLEGLWNGKK